MTARAERCSERTMDHPSETQALRRVWLWVFLGWTVLGLILALRAYQPLHASDPGVRFGPVALPVLGAIWCWAALTPSLFRWAVSQPPIQRAPGRFVLVNGPLALGLPWIHALLAWVWDFALRSHASSLGAYYLRYFDVDVLAFLTVLAAAQTVVHWSQARRETGRQVQMGAEAARAEVEAARLVAQPARLRARLSGLRTAIRQAPDRAEHAIVFLGDYLRLSLRTTGRPDIPLDEEIAMFRADREFRAALDGVAPALAVTLDPEVRSAAVPTGLFISLVDEGLLGSGSGVGDQPFHVSARLAGEVLSIEVRAPAPENGTPRPGGASPGYDRLRRRLTDLYPSARLRQTQLPSGLVQAVVEIPFVDLGASKGAHGRDA